MERDAVQALAPTWIPGPARRYLEHVALGRPIRAIARDRGVHASTILRQVRKTEQRRDDVLVDMALDRLHSARVVQPGHQLSKDPDMTATISRPFGLPDDETLDAEALRILARLTEQGACLAIARDMEKAVVVRDGADGNSIRTAIVDRAVAEAMALKDWIETRGEGRIARYHITGAGRVALRRLSELAESAGSTDPFASQHRGIGTTEMEDDERRRRRVRYNATESPLLGLSRRRDKAGKPFLAADLVAAGERLREDFELAQMAKTAKRDWSAFLTGAVAPGRSVSGGPDAAASRVGLALSELGPGLGDIVLRCCCFLEGLESVERSMCWSARSGKIVLRIALIRLKRHYDGQGADLRMIG